MRSTLYSVHYNEINCVQCTSQWDQLCSVYITMRFTLYSVHHNEIDSVQCTLQWDPLCTVFITMRSTLYSVHLLHSEHHNEINSILWTSQWSRTTRSLNISRVSKFLGSNTRNRNVDNTAFEELDEEITENEIRHTITHPKQGKSH